MDIVFEDNGNWSGLGCKLQAYHTRADHGPKHGTPAPWPLRDVQDEELEVAPANPRWGENETASATSPKQQRGKKEKKREIRDSFHQIYVCSRAEDPGMQNAGYRWT
jgi:hypothetical protein